MFFLYYFNSGDVLRKKTSKPRIKAEMLDSWEDVEGIIKACLIFLQIIRIKSLSHFGIKKSLRAYYQKRILGLQLLPIPIHQSQLGRNCLCLPMERIQVTTRAGLHMSTDWKDMSYNLTLIIINRLTWLENLLRDFTSGSPLEEHQLQSDFGVENSTLQAGAYADWCTTASPTQLYSKAQLSPQSSGPSGITFELDCSYHYVSFIRTLIRNLMIAYKKNPQR